MLESFFKLKEKGTDVKTEFLAGLTIFLTMLYIVPVNAIILSSTGMDFDALIIATALVTSFVTILNGLWANTPIAMSVGMGMNAYFAFGLVGGMQIPWETALGIVFLSGIFFLVLSATKFRRWIIDSMPLDLRRAISSSIGMFLAFIGLKQMGIIVNDEATLVSLGDLTNIEVQLGLVGILTVFILSSRNIKGAFLISVITTSIIAYILGIAQAPSEFTSAPVSIAPIAFELDILSALSLSLLPVIVVFVVTDMFDSLGTLAGIGSRAKLFDKDSKELQKTLESDAVATVSGSLLGVSTTTAFIESASGVEEGGRSGLTALFVGVLFILPIFFLPLFKAIPQNAIYPVLVMTGALMFSELAYINLKDKIVAISSFVMIIMMPLTFSITDGIASGFVVFVILKVLNQNFKSLNLGTVLIFLISLVALIVR